MSNYSNKPCAALAIFKNVVNGPKKTPKKTRDQNTKPGGWEICSNVVSLLVKLGELTGLLKVPSNCSFHDILSLP